MKLRKNYIQLQIDEAIRHFKESPAYFYHGSPLQDMKRITDIQITIGKKRKRGFLQKNECKVTRG